MMKLSGRVTSCCVALLLALTSVSAVQKLTSIDDLKKINFGQSVPKHSLLLLHWFANTVHIDDSNNNRIWLNFNPNSGDYGSHHYGNVEEILDPLPPGYRYYTIGNLYQVTSMPLPPHVVHPRREYMEGNRDRIIVRVMEQNTGQGDQRRIDRVYITQHYGTYQRTRYDRHHTYQITTDLLRQIREFPLRQNHLSLSDLRNRFESRADDSQLWDIRNTWGDLACLGLLLFIVIQERYSTIQYNYRPQNYTPQSYNTSDENEACCTILGVLLFLVLLIAWLFFSQGNKRY